MTEQDKLLTVVVIGLNEENCLQACFDSIAKSTRNSFDIEIIYVDSGSVDASLEIAKSNKDVKLLHLDTPQPSAAKARNRGIKEAAGKYIQFIDGDCSLYQEWLAEAINFLEAEIEYTCVFGNIVEKEPDKNFYTKVCARDWYIEPGEYRLCGGNSMWRRLDLLDLQGFDDSIGLGEEPDLCYRARQKGLKLYCLGREMVLHDLEMNSFQDYWNRGEASGKAYATIGLKYVFSSEKLWLREMLRNFAEPALWILISLLGFWAGGSILAICFLAAFVSYRSRRILLGRAQKIDSVSDAIKYCIHSQFIRIPVFVGQLKAVWAMIGKVGR